MSNQETQYNVQLRQMHLRVSYVIEIMLQTIMQKKQTNYEAY